MKTIFTLFLLLFTTIIFAQDRMFVHTATPANISADASFIDHPLLNNNPAAQLIVSHSWNPPGSTGVYNTNATGVFYSDSQNRWGVYNENASSMIDGSSYNIYVADGAEVITHISNAGNQGSLDAYTVINHPLLNGDTTANPLVTTYFTPNGVRNDDNYGVFYDGTNWEIYSESITTIPTDAAFFVAVDAVDTEIIRFEANAGNISGNYAIIDHPLLNGNPDAVCVFTHNWGESGDTSNILMDVPLGIWYTGTNWSIYTEDLSAMPEDAAFSIMMLDPTLGIEYNRRN